MRLYLSSYRLGNNSDELARLVSGRKRVGVIRNALDFSDDSLRQKEGLEREFADLKGLGFIPQAIDLREYFYRKEDLSVVIDGVDALWVAGGNSFVLNSAFRQSGLDKIIVERIENESFVYAGYSAGICVLTPTLEGIHLADEPDIIPKGYPMEVIWKGLGILPFCIAPHWRSDHKESSMIDESVEYFLEHKLPFIALRDGEVYITDVREMPNICFLPNTGSA
ncbi:MAG: Type 1 glutamine amidotransferase-like domain-containing protein [Pyrinomonadaceae bacterium]|nr:Type 1 glutamine amidotransferase-like domain-containing protein [Pyrinomonadaceae bacterium]